VAMWANKIQIKKSIEHVFGVEVESVNTLVVKGKCKRFRGRIGQRKDYKKAMVFLKPGHKINVQEEAGL
jgi:large subunit ribosomal protein L23